jgi:polar amino acid transport system substrate-binding protein
MRSFFRQTWAFIAVFALLSLLFAACVNINNSGTSNPLGLITPGILTVASDTTNPPLEFIDPATHQVAGFDVDLITAIAQRLGLRVQILTTKIDVIISDLENKRYDAAISAIDITPGLQAKVNFIPYFNAGESLLVQASNPNHIKGLADLCGQAVGVQGATREQADLQNASDICRRAGKPAINPMVLENQFGIVQLLVEHRVVATYQDSPVTDYFIKLNPGRFAVGGPVINASLEGIAVNKDNSALFNVIQTSFNSMKADNTYHNIIMKWGVTSEEIALVERRNLHRTIDKYRRELLDFLW